MQQKYQKEAMSYQANKQLILNKSVAQLTITK